MIVYQNTEEGYYLLASSEHSLEDVKRGIPFRHYHFDNEEEMDEIFSKLVSSEEDGRVVKL